MLKFTEIDRANPSKRGVMERIKDFREVYEVYEEDQAIDQAERCMQCGDPYCHTKCPLHNIIPAWLKQVANKDLELAFNISNETSPFPEILGRICPQDVLCEGDCSLNETHGAISIGSIETHITESGFTKGLKP
ncbi:MAG: glutamate synthase small subunit, partial [Campylobacteraceae bacterium]|nr:glutamate synthase small subunit [Campylobacteraceae bacterium]MBT5324152.1 glutamate synthase small subunit [Campylobacteraceae bacterium]MBT5983033.1 glutamate synthase small subunit [Campylobacteraceae bacterium]MBT7273585.1 glutamate synthase small subunit [Campylobacteraceae bacterium]